MQGSAVSAASQERFVVRMASTCLRLWVCISRDKSVPQSTIGTRRGDRREIEPSGQRRGATREAETRHRLRSAPLRKAAAHIAL